MAKEPISKNLKKTCPYCGNNPVMHFPSFVAQSLSVFLTPMARFFSWLDNKFSRSLGKAILTPYFHFFKFLHLLKFNTDPEKSATERSKVIWQEAIARGIKMEQFVIFGKPIEEYRAEIGGKWKYFESLPIPPKLNTSSYSWIDNKVILKKCLIKKNIPVAQGGRADSWSLALSIFNKIRKPVIVKPEVGSRGRHSITHINTLEELKKAYKVAKELCYFVLIEEHLFGSVYRGTYVGGEIVGVLRGDLPRITGNGNYSIKKLIENKNRNKPQKVKDFAITSSTNEFLERQGYSLETILQKGVTIDLSEKIGLSYGGFSVEMLPQIHSKILTKLKEAGDLIKAPVVGFDFIIPDPTSNPDNQKWGIIEANSLPFIDLHHHPALGEPVNVAGKIWDLWKK